MNCKTITNGETTAGALRPLFMTPAIAIPRTVQHADPSKTNHANRIHRVEL